MHSLWLNAKGKIDYLSRKQKLVYWSVPVQKGLLASAVLSTSQNNFKLFRIRIGGFKLLTAPVSATVHGRIAIDLNGSEMGCYILSMDDSPLLELQSRKQCFMKHGLILLISNHTTYS